MSKSYKHDQSDFLDVALGATIAADCAPVVGTSWTEYEDEDLTDTQVGWSTMPARYEGQPPKFIIVKFDAEVVSGIEQFLALKGGVKRACRVAASRLNLAKRRVDPGDSAIDLSTAFEALLGTSDERNELTYRFRLRAALLLEESYEARREVSRKIADLYSMRGKVVHGDSSGASTAQESETVEFATESCQRLLRLVVVAGKLPDLRKLELTGRTSAAFE